MYLSLIPLNHALLCSLRYIDYRDKFYVLVASILAGAIDIIGAFMVLAINNGAEIPFNFTWYVGGLACACAVTGYFMNFKLKARKKKEKAEKNNKKTSHK